MHQELLCGNLQIGYRMFNLRIPEVDLILVERIPLENIDLIVDQGRNFVVIMKEGRTC